MSSLPPLEQIVTNFRSLRERERDLNTQHCIKVLIMHFEDQCITLSMNLSSDMVESLPEGKVWKADPNVNSTGFKVTFSWYTSDYGSSQ